MVLSPAKTMNLRPLSERQFTHDDMNATSISQINKKYDCTTSTSSSGGSIMLCDFHKTAKVCNEMKSKSEGQLKDLLGLSVNLSKVAHKFWSDFDVYHHEQVASSAASGNDEEYKPAMYTFSGPAYQGLAPDVCDTDTIDYLASNLFILDPVYGVLRSSQNMQPYRLEMGCKLFNGAEDGEGSKKKETLSSFWRESVTSYLSRELLKIDQASSQAEEGEYRPILANLASEEYSSSIIIRSLPRNTIFLNIVFRHQGRVLAVHAKKARGLMARYIAQRGATTIQEISEFNLENYQCITLAGQISEVLDTVGDNVHVVRMIFDRDAAPPKAKAVTAASKRAAKKAEGEVGEGKRAKKST